MSAEILDVAPGLWIWRRDHPAWTPQVKWEPPVTSTCVASGGEVAVMDALAPPDEAKDVWERLDANPPTIAVVLKPDHVRDVDLFVERYGVRAYGPDLFFAGDAPKQSSTGSAKEASCPAASSRSTTDADETRRPCGFRSSGRSSSPTR